jgi:hypothetical protein
MISKKFRWVLLFCVNLLVVMACGQLSVKVLTPTPENLVDEVASEGIETLGSVVGDEMVANPTLMPTVSSPALCHAVFLVAPIST